MPGRRGALLLLAALVIACQHRFDPPESGIDGLAGATRVYTLTNLHPDPQDNDLYSTNFQDLGLIPVCSEVTLKSVGSRSADFEVNATRQEYSYHDHSLSNEPFSANLARYFGPACPRAELDALTPLEKDAVQRGIVVVGMRKPAVILALGYPPLGHTRTTELPTWQYWRTTRLQFTVVFDDDDRVEKIGN